MKTDAIVFESEMKVGIRTIEVPRLNEGQVLVKTHYSSISPGTELRTLAGKEKHASCFPLIPGYSVVGEVFEFGSGVKGLEKGMMATLRGGLVLNDEIGSSWGGHCGYIIVPQEEVFLLPAGVDPRQATLVPLLATALHGMDMANVRIREQAAVVGLGLVGQLCAILLKYCGANVVATDLIEYRRMAAEKAGIPVVAPGSDLRKGFEAYFPYGAELVVDATGSPKTMAPSLSLLREKPRQDPCGSADDGSGEGCKKSMFEILKQQSHLQNGWRGPRIIVQGSYAQPIEICYYDLFDNEVGFAVPRVHELKDIYRAIELLSEPAFDLGGLLGESLSYKEAPSVYNRIVENPSRTISECFKWI
jgi:2-desacetyl-2-hydroxyethyl bacteriochlorophyllide A dehydrogenase